MSGNNCTDFTVNYSVNNELSILDVTMLFHFTVEERHYK